MIKKIKVLSRVIVLCAIQDGRPLCRSHKWNLISIYTKPEEEVLTPDIKQTLPLLNCLDSLSLHFADITRDEYFKYYEELKRKRCDALFNEEQARQIIEFVNKINKKDDDEYLVVHCDAGISRSGAVGTFINDYLGLDYKQFKDMNRGIRPNQYILDVLQNVSGIKLSEQNSAFGYFNSNDGVF